jgi:uncharacterized protein YbcV (DUF1398 family)
MAHTVVMNALWSSLLVYNKVPHAKHTTPNLAAPATRPGSKPPFGRPEEKPPYWTSPLPEYLPLWEQAIASLVDKLTTLPPYTYLGYHQVVDRLVDIQPYNAIQKLCDRCNPSAPSWHEHIIIVWAYLEAYCLILPYLSLVVIQEVFHHFAKATQLYVLLQLLKAYDFLYSGIWIRFWASTTTRKQHRKAKKQAKQKLHRAKKKQERQAERKSKDRHKTRHTRFRTFMLALTTLPSCINGADHGWTQTLHAYVSDETGWLRTKDLPQSTLLSLRDKLADFGMEEEVKSLLQRTHYIQWL